MSLVFSLWLLLLLQPNHSARLETTESCHRKKKYFTCTLPIIILTSVKETSNFWATWFASGFCTLPTKIYACAEMWWCTAPASACQALKSFHCGFFEQSGAVWHFHGNVLSSSEGTSLPFCNAHFCPHVGSVALLYSLKTTTFLQYACENGKSFRKSWTIGLKR